MTPRELFDDWWPIRNEATDHDSAWDGFRNGFAAARAMAKKPHRWQHPDGDTWCVDCGLFSRNDDGNCTAQECGDFDADSPKGNATILGLITGNEVQS